MMLYELHKTGQPVLVVFKLCYRYRSCFRDLMIQYNIPHNVLNASNAFWEAQIIAGAGQLNAVTVATTMAGRGTDIKLGEGVKELGGSGCYRCRKDGTIEGLKGRQEAAPADRVTRALVSTM